MLSERITRQRPDFVRAQLQRRHAGADTEHALERWLTLDARRRAETSPGEAPSAGSAAESAAVPTGRGRRAAEGDARAALNAEMHALLALLPNLPDARVPDGSQPEQNVEIRRWGVAPTFAFRPYAHDELAAALGMLDLARATRISGARFPLLLGDGARLARALAALMLDLHTRAGYLEVGLPHLVRPAILTGSGHLPRHAADLYTVAGDDLRLSPTAEVQLVALHAGEILPAEALPLAYTACAPAFRREAGSAGAASRGLLRQHQFDKVELVRISTPEDTDAAFDAILGEAERVAQCLELPYRIVALCAGELPFTAARTYDIEVWMAGQGRYVEVSSVSDCGTYQARGLGIRYHPRGGRHARYAHTLNGSALAIGRTLAALLEQGQQADGSVMLPRALAPYLPRLELRPPAAD